MDHQAQYDKMTKTPIPKLVLSLAVPTIISMLITSIYNTADTYFVSLLDDTSATGAVSIVFSLMALIQAVSFTVGMGASSWLSRLLGRQEQAKANEVASTALFMAFFFGMILFALPFFDTTPLMRLLGSTETILPYAKAYADYILLGAPMLMGSFVLNHALRAEGKARFSMIGIMTGSILNIILDPFFILDFGLGMKTAGAALATAISQTVSFVILLIPFLRGRTVVKLSLRSISRQFSCYWQIVRNGLPALCRQGLSSISTMMLNRAIAALALANTDAAIAAMGIVAKVFMLVFSVVLGIGQGYQPVMGYNYGAKRYDRAREAFFFTLKATTLAMTTFAVISYFAAPSLISVFSSERSDPDMLRIGVGAFRAWCLAMPFVPTGVMANMTFQSVGQAWRATFLSSCRQGLYLLPILFVLPRMIGLTGVQIAQPISDTLTFLTCIPFLVHFLREMKAMEEQGTV